MSRLGVIALVLLSLALTSCYAKQGLSEDVEVEALVTELPPGVEGVELAKEGLRLKKGYRLVKDSDSTFAIERVSDGQRAATGSCGCWVGVGCIQVQKGLIWVCQPLPTGCIKCGLKLTSGGISTELFRYTKKQPG
jgi:hypothetical protein